MNRKQEKRFWSADQKRFVYSLKLPHLWKLIFRRRDKIRTCDLCVPNAALYQTEPRDDFANANRVNIKIINKNPLIVKQKTNMIEEKVAKTIKSRN